MAPAIAAAAPADAAAASGLDVDVDELRAMLQDQPTAAIEARWDGDTDGWYVVLEAIVERPSPDHPHYCALHLASLQGSGGDMRLFSGLVPPWPEAERATLVGEELARHLGVPFYFPSAAQPDDTAPRWWARAGDRAG